MTKYCWLPPSIPWWYFASWIQYLSLSWYKFHFLDTDQSSTLSYPFLHFSWWDEREREWLFGLYHLCEKCIRKMEGTECAKFQISSTVQKGEAKESCLHSRESEYLLNICVTPSHGGCRQCSSDNPWKQPWKLGQIENVHRAARVAFRSEAALHLAAHSHTAAAFWPLIAFHTKAVS